MIGTKVIFFVGDGEQTARSNEDEGRSELRAVV
jgi:hypothetical protein